MNPPRDLLLNRHQGAWRALASARRRALLESLPKSRPLWWRTLVIESFAPLRLAWAALAACWILILFLQLGALHQWKGSATASVPVLTGYPLSADSRLIAELNVKFSPSEGRP